jgi:hypothetical protein
MELAKIEREKKRVEREAKDKEKKALTSKPK